MSALGNRAYSDVIPTVKFHGSPPPPIAAFRALDSRLSRLRVEGFRVASCYITSRAVVLERDNVVHAV